MSRFAGRVVLVTGAAGGIGLAAARGFAVEGAAVVLADVNELGVQMAAAGLSAEGFQASSTYVDVRDPASCRAMVEHAMDRFGGLHACFNNAGVPTPPYASFEDVPDEDWDRAIAVNLNGVFHSMRAEIPALRKSKGTSIVNTASMMSGKAAPGMAAYVASKHGVAGLTRAAALDCVPHGIRVNAICPGFVDTPMLSPVISNEAGRTMVEGMVPSGRIASPDEIARAVLFLSSEEASYMVGSLMVIDGGVTVR